MALQPSHFIYPVGELQPAMFPDHDLATNVQIWLDEAVTKSANEKIQEHWVYYRGNQAVATRLALTPTSETGYSGDASRTVGDGRVKYFNDLANAHLNEVNRLLEEESFMDGTKMAKVIIL